MSFGPDIVLEVDAASAPESCGSFYWDPLLLAVDGDGQSAAYSGQGYMSSCTGLQPAGVFSLGVLVVAALLGVGSA